MSDNTKISKYLSYILRHNPDAIGLQLDENGWASMNELIERSCDFDLNEALLQLVVETNDKQRFRISEDGKHIKANQGHSIDVDLDLEPLTPPDILLHGTAVRFMGSIKDQGLLKKNRHHVHLTESRVIAEAVGQRYGKAVILEIVADKMQHDGFKFYCTENGVWLVDCVPVQYIQGL